MAIATQDSMMRRQRRRYVRTTPSTRCRPPRDHRRDRLAAREPVLRPLNIALTILTILLIFWIVPPIMSSCSRTRCGAAPIARPACRPRSAEVGACWAFMGDRFAYFIYGSYPIPERWRVDLFFALLAFGIVWLLWLDAPRRELGALFFFVVVPLVSYPSVRLAADRLRRSTPRCGAACWSPSWCPGRHRVLAADRHSAGARTALVHAGGEAVLGHLHRVRARRPADHRLVHGQRHAAVVRAAGLVARQAGARAGRRTTFASAYRPRWCARACRRSRAGNTKAQRRWVSGIGS